MTRALQCALAVAAGALLMTACGGDDGPAGPSTVPASARYVDEPACSAPRCFELDVPVPDGVRITDARVRVLVPADYEQTDRRYPMLLLLHDAPGDYTSWTRLGNAQAQTEGLDVVVVMPDGGGEIAGWYSNWRDGSYQWETYHIDVMLPYIEQQLRVLGAGHRAVAGASMGGFGAMSYSARYPGLFVAAAGFSGAVDFLHLGRISALYGFLGNPIAGTPNGPIWGDPLTNYDIWQAHDPGTHVDGLAGMKIFLTSGNGLPGGPHDDPTLLPLYVIEPLLLIMNLSFARTLADAGVEHETWFYGPGFHDWPYYRDAFAWALPGLIDAIKP